MSDETETETATATDRVYTAAEIAKEQEAARRARSEAKANRLAMEQARADKETAEAALATASSAHTERLTAVETRFVKAELKAAAIASGINDPSDALSLIDMSKIERDADGTPTNAAELLAELKAAKPYLFAAETGAAPRHTSNPAPAPRAAPAVTKLAKDMTPAEYAAAKSALYRK